MAYIVPPTFTSGAILTAAQMTILGNDILAGGPIYTTTGARDTAIPAPFAGQRAFISGTNVNVQYNGAAWVSAQALSVPPMCRARRSTDQTFANAVNGLVNFNSEDIDTDAMFAPTSNVITIKTAGVYSVHAVGGVQIHPNGQRALFVIINPVISGTGDGATLTSGTRIASSVTQTTNAGATNSMLSTSTIFSCAVNDTLAMCVFQNAGGSLTATGLTTEQMTLSVAMIGKIA